MNLTSAHGIPLNISRIACQITILELENNWDFYTNLAFNWSPKKVAWARKENLMQIRQPLCWIYVLNSTEKAFLLPNFTNQNGLMFRGRNHYQWKFWQYSTQSQHLKTRKLSCPFLHFQRSLYWIRIIISLSSQWLKPNFSLPKN